MSGLFFLFILFVCLWFFFLFFLAKEQSVQTNPPMHPPTHPQVNSIHIKESTAVVKVDAGTNVTGFLSAEPTQDPSYQVAKFSFLFI